MAGKSLGTFEKVDLEAIWETEAGDFTPWLAGEGNLAQLGGTFGLELELEATEKNVGPFRADILCKDTATGHWVLIENQLGRTDHKHLGQLLTYAAGLQAVTIVWIATPFTEEHRATLDWLNEITDDRFRFFGIEIEFWRIGQSPPAPRFNFVSKPNDWTRAVSKAATDVSDGVITETKRLQLEYWTELKRYLEDHRGDVRPTKPLPQHWMTFSVGRANFLLVTFANTREKRIGVYLQMLGADAKAHYRLLHDEKAQIEQEFGEELEWRELPDKKESQVMLRSWNADPTNWLDWPRLKLWWPKRASIFISPSCSVAY
jgi:hypothetical protein